MHNYKEKSPQIIVICMIFLDDVQIIIDIIQVEFKRITNNQQERWRIGGW